MRKFVRPGQDRWIECGNDFIGAAWFWPSRIAAVSTAVVIVPGIAHEERTMNGGLVALAEALSDAGLPALLMDLHGCGQSAGGIGDADIGARWQTNIRSAVRHAHDCGAARVIVIGVRLGFALAVDALADTPLAALTAWAPIVSGKRYVRELKLLQSAAEQDAAGGVAIAGFSIPASTLAHIATLDLAGIETRTPRIMLCDMADGMEAPWLSRLAEQGVAAERLQSSQIDPWLFGDADQPSLPHDDIRALAGWCRARHDEAAVEDTAPPRRPSPQPSITFRHHGRVIRETFVEIGPNGLTGVLSAPAEAPGDNAVRLLMSTVGPGRTFTDFARDEASLGNSSLRFDFSGFGTSGRGSSVQGGQLYTDDGCHDVLVAIAYLREAGHQRIYGLGFCAGAWSMMQAEVAPELRAMVAINVALYRQPGPSTPRLGKGTRQRLVDLSPAMARPLLRGVAARVRRPERKRREPIDWLLRLCDTDMRALLAYADQDPGLPYLNRQMDKGLQAQLRRPFALQIYPGLGHLAEGLAARTQLFSDIADFFAELDDEVPAVRNRPSRPDWKLDVTACAESPW